MTPDDLPDPETAAADAADDAHTERWREERARGREHEVECPWLTDGCASRGRLHRPLKGGTDDDICIECLESCCCGALRKHGARVRADERERAAGRVEAVEGGIVYRLDPGEVPGRGYLAESDHLAALERVRVETLREVWAAVDRAPAWSREAARMQTKCLAAIDRLIDATTTPVEGS